MYTAPQSPRSIGGVMDDAIELLKASFSRVWGVALVYSLLSGGLGMYQQRILLANAVGSADIARTFAVYGMPSIWGGYLLLIALGTLLYMVMIGILAGVAQGRDVHFGQLIGPALLRLPLALVGMIAYLLATFAGMALLVIPGIYIGMRLMLWLVPFAAEERGPFASLGESWRLMKGHWWRTAIILTVFFVLAALVGALIGAVFGVLAATLDMSLITILLWTQATQAIAQVVTVPAIAAVLVALHHDLRLRRDGGDLEARLGGLNPSA